MAALGAGFAPAQDSRPQDSKALLTQLEADWQKAYGAWVKAKQAAESKSAPFTDPEPTPVLVARAWEHAQALAGKADALPFLAWIVRRDFYGKDAKAAIDAALRDHARSEGLVDVASHLRLSAWRIGNEAAIDACTRVVEASPHAKVQATALLARSTILGEELWDSLPEAKRQGVLRDLLRARELTTEAILREQCDRLAFALERLQVGKVVPEIEGQDLDDQPIKLSDWRGTVIMLDFWGHW
jgi:hypothetical protein